LKTVREEYLLFSRLHNEHGTQFVDKDTETYVK